MVPLFTSNRNLRINSVIVETKWTVTVRTASYFVRQQYIISEEKNEDYAKIMTS